jgi:glycosyltransferase involved in cell wall biosynthesis
LVSLLWIPDDRTGWIFPAVKRGLKIAQSREIRTVLTTSPPHSVQLIGLMLKKILKKRWVVDFRDPWSLPYQSDRDLYATVNRWLEKKVIKNADLVIVATEVVRKGYQAAYSGQAEKVVCIPNGYDHEDFKEARRRQKPESYKCSISYLGEFYIGRTPEVFLRAVSELVRGGRVPIQKLQIRFVGKVRNIGRKSLQKLVAEQGLSSVTEILQPVPHHKAIEYMVNSDVLLVFSPQPFFQPTKVFEYMAAGAWVIAFTPPGALADLVGQYSKGIVVGYTDVEAAKEAVLACYEKWMGGKGIVQGEDVQMTELLAQYERKNLTKQLSMYLG